MMNYVFEICLAAIVVLALSVMLYANKRTYQSNQWHVVLCFAAGALAGFFGAYLMGFIENGRFGSKSYFGTVFLPLAAIPIVAKQLKENPNKMLDLAALGQSLVLAIAKIHCYLLGCCGGRKFINPITGGTYTFPSQIVESAVGFILFTILFVVQRKQNNKEKIYPLFLLGYGMIRFILNLFRDAEPFIGVFPIGNLWALISMMLGVVMIAKINKKNKPKVVHKKK